MEAFEIVKATEEQDRMSVLQEPRTGMMPAGDYPDSVKQEGYREYLGGSTFDDVAVLLGVTTSTVKYWARKGNWVARKEEVERVAMNAADLDYRRFLSSSRLPNAERHLRVAAKLEALIEEELRALEGEDPGTRAVLLRRLSEALGASATISARAAGITDRPAPVSSPDDAGKRKQPLVVIGITPRPAGGTGGDVIEVESREC